MIDIPLAGLKLPRLPPPSLPLLDLPLFDLAGSGDQETSSLFERERVLDPVQTQTFHTLCYTRANSLVAAPDGHSRSVLLQLALWCVGRHLIALTHTGER